MIYSSGVAVIDFNHPIPKVLVVRAYSNWDFPKGKHEEGETAEMAAVRELEEETSLKVPDDVEITGIWTPEVVYGRPRKTAKYLIGIRTSDVEPYLPVSPSLGKPENDEYRWVSFKDLEDLMPDRLQDIVKSICAYIELRRVLD